jgi:hypothetical protein
MSTDTKKEDVLKKISILNKFNLFKIEGFISGLLAAKNIQPMNQRRPLLTKGKGASM